MESQTPPYAQVGWASTSDSRPQFPPVTASPWKSPDLEVPASLTARVRTLGPGGEPSEEKRGVESPGIDEILPRDARTGLLDFKPGDMMIASTARGWHVLKV